MIKVAINGFGRIGKATFRNILDKHPKLQVVAINDLADAKTLSHLLKYDSIYGAYNKKIGSQVKFFSDKDPEKLPWGKLGVDVVLECTGYFTDLKGASKHLKAGAKKVIISTPCKGERMPTYVLGVNENKYNPKTENVVSMASCTTNCLAPVVKVLNDNFKIVKGFMTTCHSYTSSQNVLDSPHKDLRRARAAALNIIPTSTGATTAIGYVIPEVAGKLDGIAFRIPTPIVSIIDLVCEVEKKTTTAEVNKLFKKVIATKPFKDILDATEEPLVSSDYIGNSNSSIVDLPLTMVKDNMIKVVAWYDNEWGYASRLAEFTEYVVRNK